MVALLVATILHIGNALGTVPHPLERPSALRVSAEQIPGRSISKSSALLESRVHHFAEPDTDDKAGKEGAGEVEPVARVEVKGEDPAAKAEEEALEAVPKTLPPKEKVETDVEDTMKTAAELTGVEPNAHGDMKTCLLTLSINAGTVLICALVFSALRMKYPLIYSHNVVIKNVPFKPAKTFFGWVHASLATTTEQAAKHVGLDGAMLLEFFNMSCKLLATIGIPMVCIMCPLHYVFGGGGLGSHALSSIAMGNVMRHHPWLYYVHAVIVNLVTFTVVKFTYDTMTKFQRLRFDWLRELPAPRCLAVLVEGIPDEYRSDEKLLEFFSTQFHAGHVKDAVVVKDARALVKLHDEQTKCRDGLKEAEEEWEKNDCPEDDRPTFKQMLCMGEEFDQSSCGDVHDTIKFYESRLNGPEGLDAKVDEAREAAIEAAKTVGGINTSTGFVTFAKRRQAATATCLVFSSNREEWVVSIPPPASDVLWNDLKQESHLKTAGTLTAYGLVMLLYAFFIPLVVIGTNLTLLVEFGPHLQPIWASFAPGLALMLLLGFLPTILLLIFRLFLTLKADSFAQHKLQIWYFFFLVFFVILVTTIGSNLVQLFAKIARRPETAMWLMARNMPQATHFYMDFLMLQWAEQGIHFMRHVQLGKFLLWRFFHEEPAAKEMSEPEDQDYYGIGSRSARFTMTLLVGIIFSTLSPLIAIFCLVLFCLCRLFYGYLIVFAETKKPDLGGVFFFTMLQHLLMGTGVYVLLMLGVLLARAKTKAPFLIALPALFYLIYSYKRLSEMFVWNELPYKEVDNKGVIVDNGLRYIQPEFMTDEQKATLSRANEQTDFRSAKSIKIMTGDLRPEKHRPGLESLTEDLEDP